MYPPLFVLSTASLCEEKGAEELRTFLEDYPGLVLVEPTISNYESVSAAYVIENNTIPLAIVRPQTSEDVAALVSYCIASKIQLVVRPGENYFYDLSGVQDTVIIDMKDINFVKVNETKSSARIGGGILLGKLTDHLSQEGLVTAIGTVPFVEYTGWAAFGGYGPFSAQYGLGVDNILAAKIVNAKGKLVEANDEMLKGIRGAGGFIGIIVELTIKVCSLQSILAGVLIFDSQDLSETFRTFTLGFAKLLATEDLAKFNALQLIINTSQGKVFAVSCLWNSEDIQKGKAVVAKLASLGKVTMNTVTSTSLASYLNEMGALMPPRAYGTVQSLKIESFVNETMEIVGTNISRMPHIQGVAFVIHQFRGPSALPKDNSVFSSRTPHYMLEFISTVSEEQHVQEAAAWVKAFMIELGATEPSTITRRTYVSMTTSEGINLSEIHDVNHNDVVQLKRKYDPHNTFSLAIPRFR